MRLLDRLGCVPGAAQEHVRAPAFAGLAGYRGHF
jgi:hypothetical protein